MRTQGREAVQRAGRVYRAAFKAWQKANSRRKRATLERLNAERKARQAIRKLQDALRLLFPW